MIVDKTACESYVGKQIDLPHARSTRVFPPTDQRVRGAAVGPGHERPMNLGVAVTALAVACAYFVGIVWLTNR